MLLFATMLALLAPIQAPSRPAQIILIRHAEKPLDEANPHLAPAGVERAARLVSFLTTDPAMTTFGMPVAVFATATTKNGDGVRTQETIAPLAKKLKLPVQTPALGKDYAVLAAGILRKRAYAGKTVVICWNHEWLPELAAALGVTPQPAPWKGSDFDRVFVITYSAGKATLTETTEVLGPAK